MLTEFGGATFSKEGGTWGYSRADSARTFEKRYTELLKVVNSLALLAGFCYTQFADTYQEANGLLFADRTPKFPIQRIALATLGGKMTREAELSVGSNPTPGLGSEEQLPQDVVQAKTVET